MAQPLYFLPHLRADAAEGIHRKGVLRERGLAEVFADVPYDQQPLFELKARGPDNLPGCIVCYQTALGGQIPRRQSYTPEEQTWTRISDGLWIGLDPAEPPRPHELQRRKRYNGYSLALADEQTWMVPVIRRSDPDKPTELPRALMRNSSGVIVEEIKADFRSYFDGIKPLADWLYSEPTEVQRDQVQQIYQWAVLALGINYRFGWAEQNAMQLVDTECCLPIIAAACDVPAHKDTVRAKKNESGQSAAASSTPGQPAASPTTNQAGAISI